MIPEDFVKGFYVERKKLLEYYFNPKMKTEAGTRISGLNLNKQDLEKLKQLLHTCIGDAFYTILLGLDGAATIGDTQQQYQIFDENNNELTGGEIEGCAWEYFQNRK